MRHVIEFTKASGAGNDFVLIDNMDERLGLDKAQLAQALCSRRFGVGADGLLLLEPSTQGDFFMRYYNADGSYGGMCGNGGRCVARYAYVHSIAKSPMRFVALDHTYQAEIIGGLVRLKMKDSSDYRQRISIDVDNQVYAGSFLNTGSPHTILFVKDLEGVDVERIGQQIRQHSLFSPEGTNVNFVRIGTANSIDIRTYERGVEAETLACGTGSVASALVAAFEHGLKSPVRVRVRSGEDLHVYFEIRGQTASEVYLEGSARFLFTGTTVYDSETGLLIDTVTEHSLHRSTLSP